MLLWNWLFWTCGKPWTSFAINYKITLCIIFMYPCWVIFHWKVYQIYETSSLFWTIVSSFHSCKQCLMNNFVSTSLHVFWNNFCRENILRMESLVQKVCSFTNFELYCTHFYEREFINLYQQLMSALFPTFWPIQSSTKHRNRWKMAHCCFVFKDLFSLF